MLAQRGPQDSGSGVQGQQRTGVGEAWDSRIPFDHPTCRGSDLAHKLEALYVAPCEHPQRGVQDRIVFETGSRHRYAPDELVSQR